MLDGRDEGMFACSKLIPSGVPRDFWAESGPLHTQDWEPVTITRQALSLVDKAEPVQVRFTLCSRDQRSKWMQDECKVYMVSYMTLNGSCFMVTWTIFKNRLLKVGMTQNRETMALRTLTTGWFILFYQVWGSVGIDIHWNGMWLKDPFTYDFTLHLRPRGHTRWFWRCWDGLWTLSFGLSQFHGHGSWLMCEVALRGWSHWTVMTPFVGISGCNK